MKADGGCEYVRSGTVCDFATSETLVSFILVRLREVPSSRRGEDFCPKLNIVLTSLGPTPHTLLPNLKRKYIYIYSQEKDTGMPERHGSQAKGESVRSLRARLA